MKKSIEKVTVELGEYLLLLSWNDILDNRKLNISRDFFKVGKYSVYRTDYYKLVFSKDKGTAVLFSAPGKLIVESWDKITIITAVSAKEITNRPNLDEAYAIRKIVKGMLSQFLKKERVNACE